MFFREKNFCNMPHKFGGFSIWLHKRRNVVVKMWVACNNCYLIALFVITFFLRMSKYNINGVFGFYNFVYFYGEIYFGSVKFFNETWFCFAIVCAGLRSTIIGSMRSSWKLNSEAAISQKRNLLFLRLLRWFHLFSFLNQILFYFL